MTVEDFSNRFDTLINSYARTYGFGQQDLLAFDEYEKSVFLTKAQEQLVISLYNGRNSSGDSFESSEEMRRCLESLINQIDVTSFSTDGYKIGNYSYKASLDKEVMFIIYESVDWNNAPTCLPRTNIQVVPVTHDEYHRIKNNPFRGPNDHRVLRIDNSKDEVELISKFQISKYTYRFMKKPTPIILINLKEEGLDINGHTEIHSSELNDLLHERILELGVQYALQSKNININNNNQ